jgi:hypothetical protein
VTASDGSTSDYDEFFIIPSGLSLIFLINLFIKIFGPIFAVLGFYKYKRIFLNILFKKKVFFSPEYVKKG